MIIKIRRKIALLLYPEIKKIQPEIREILKKCLEITIYNKQPIIIGIIRAGRTIQDLILNKKRGV